MHFFGVRKYDSDWSFSGFMESVATAGGHMKMDLTKYVFKEYDLPASSIYNITLIAN